MLSREFVREKKFPFWLQIVMTVVFFGFILLICYLSDIFVYVENGNTYLNMLFYFLMFFACVFIYRFWFNVSFNRLVLISVSSYALQHIGYRFSWYFTDYLFYTSGLYLKITTLFTYCLFVYSIMTVCYALVFVFCYFTFLKKIKKYRVHELNVGKVLIPSALLLLVVLILNTIATAYTYNGSPNVYPLVSVISAFCILSCAMVMFLNVSYIENANLIRQNVEQNKYYKDQIKRYEIAKENVELINIKCHDLRKQMRVLREGDDSLNDKKMQDIENSIRIYDSTIVTDSYPLNIVLSEASLQVKDRQITFTTVLDGKLLKNIDDVDVFSIFGNILDNAIEATCKLEDISKRVISLTLKEDQGFIDIECLNYYEGDINSKNGVLKTTKKDAHNHGYGIKSIINTAKKYGGNAVFKYEDHMFKVKVLIPLK